MTSVLTRPTQDVCAEVIFGETSVLRAPAQEDALVEARTFIGAVVYARYDADPTRFAPKKHPTADELADETIKKHWELCKQAAKAAQNVSIDKCRHYVLWWRDAAGNYPAKTPERIPDDWPYDYADKITKSWGPFVYHGTHGGQFYIFRYCGVP